MFGPHGFAQQDCTSSPLAAKTKSHQRAGGEHLLEILGQSGQQREQCKPCNCDLQHTHASITIRKPAAQPSANGRNQQRCGADDAGLPRVKPQIEISVGITKL